MSLTIAVGKGHSLAWISIKRVWRSVLIGGAAISAFAIAQPALAYTELGTTGTVGFHKIRDTSHDPGTTCYFKQRSGSSQYQLKHLYAIAPLMKAVPGMGTERVAWSFTVQRRIVGSGGAGPWKDDYTSPKYTSHTDSTRTAGFDLDEGVKVVVPFPPGGSSSADYRVIDNLFWYKHDQTTILGTATDRVDWYYTAEAENVGNLPGFCPDYN